MSPCVECLASTTCVWFAIGSKRNILASMLAGTLFFVGWWIYIDAHAKYPTELSAAYIVCGLFGTISLFMVNGVTDAQIRGESSSDACFGGRGAAGWLFSGFVIGFAAVIAACWILFVDFIDAGAPHKWPGVSLFLQNLFIFMGSLAFKFGRTEEE